MLPRQPRTARPARRMYVAFVVDGTSFALPAERSAGVGELRDLLRLPSADPCRLGVVVHRSRAVALLAAAPTTAEGARREAAARYYVVLRGDGDGGDGEDFAVAVDELAGLKVESGDRHPEGFLPYDRHRLTAAPADAGGERAEGTTGA